MKPTDRSDAHLEDRMVEIRAVKSAVAMLIVAIVAIFSSWLLAIVVFGLGYLAYQARYYSRRVGVYTNQDLSARHDRLEYALVGFVVAVAGTFIAIESVFEDDWELGGFLSLPAIDLTDFNALISEPIVPAAWLIVLAPVIVLSYAGLQFRKRLLVGIDSRQAAIRATIWDLLGRLPIALLWLAALTVQPVYELWKPAVETVETEMDLSAGTTGEFIVVFEGSFQELLLGSFAVSAGVLAAYLVVQKRKYEDGTVPEVLGYRGLWPARRDTHVTNMVVPITVYLLCIAAAYAIVGTDLELQIYLVGAIGISVVLGANVRAVTTKTLQRASEELAGDIDAVATGLVVGFVALVGLSQVIGPPESVIPMTLLYPVGAVPATYGGNWLVGYQTATGIDDYAESVETDWNAFDETTVDRLFVYSDARNGRLRRAAVGGLASSMQANTYRKNDAMGVFAEALESTDEETVQAGLNGMAAALRYDQSKQTYDWLVSFGALNTFLSYLDSEDVNTRAYAAEAAARTLTIELTTTHPGSQRLGEPHIGQMQSIAENNTQYAQLLSGITEYFTTLWYQSVAADVRPTNNASQQLLGGVLWMAEYSDQYTRHRAVFGLTSTRAPADDQRVSIALRNLESKHEESRYLAAHVVRSSMDSHVESIDSEQVAALLDDRSPAVRSMGAKALTAMFTFDPESGPRLLDRLILALEDQHQSASRAEGNILRAVSNLPPERVLDHPTARTTVADYVGVSNGFVAKHAASLLSTLVASSHAVAGDETVRNAIETGLSHPHPEVRLACLDAAASVVDGSVQNGRQFVTGLGSNLGTPGRHSVLAAVTLAEIVDSYPDAGLEIIPELGQGLRNQTPVETQDIPFLVSGSRVSAVVVDIVSDAIAADPSRGQSLIEPLVGLAEAAEASTLGRILSSLAELSAEFTEESQQAVKPAANALQTGRVSARSDAAQLLANVAAYHPESVAPFVDRLIVATDDNSPRVRAPALDALRNVCTAIPAAVEDDIHQLIGLLDDDSAIVRKRAAALISTVAERQPDIIDPAAETADRLRRLQRDPAVDVDSEQLQDASTAIQTGVAADEVESEDREEIWSPESGDEMGVSGDTEVFEPVGDDFDPGLDEEFEEAPEPTDEEATDDGEPDKAVGGQETAIAPDDDDEDVGGQETVITPDDDDQEDVSGQETVIAPDDDDQEDVSGQETVIAPDDDDEDVGGQETVIEPSDDEDDSDGTADNQ